MLDLDEELLSLNIDMKSMKMLSSNIKMKLINSPLKQKKKKKFKLLTMSNSLKRAAKDKQSELDNLVKKRCIEEKKQVLRRET